MIDGLAGGFASNVTSGEIIILWDRRIWRSVNIQQGIYSVSVILESLQEQFRWCFTGVYGRHSATAKEDLLYEIAAVRGLWDGNWVIGGVLMYAVMPMKNPIVRE